MSNNRKVLFAHDSYLFRTKENGFYGEHLDNNIKKRYLYLGEEVSFMMRLKEVENKELNRLSKIDKENFNFIAVPNFKSISNYFKYINRAKHIVNNAVSAHDVLVARLPSAIGSLAVKAARNQGRPYLVEYVGCVFDAYWNFNWKGKMIAHYKMWGQKRLMKNVPYTIYVTKKYLQQKYPTNGKSTNCSNVELPTINEENLRQRIEKIQELGKKNLVLGTVAAIDVPYKGQDDVIKAVGLLKKEGLHVSYKLVGSGDPSRLQKLIFKNNVQDRVQIVGRLKHEKVFEFIQEIDLYIQPSKQEGLPRALIEAMSMAAPALGARTAGIPELLQNECIFSAGSVLEIYRKIKQISTQWLLNQAKQNFNEAKLYQKNILEKRRLSFFDKFIEHELPD